MPNVLVLESKTRMNIHEYYGYSLLYYHLTNKSVTSVLWLITDAHKLFLCLAVTSVQREAHKQSDV